MIKTKSIFMSPDPLDGIRVLITQGSANNKLKQYPFDLHFGELGPSFDLLSDYKGWGGRGSITWDVYVERFIEEMKSPKSKEAIDTLAEQSLAGEIFTLLCYEGEQNPHCHRHIVKKLILEAESKLKRSKSREKGR